MSQEAYIHEILRRFNMEDVRTVKNPVESMHQLVEIKEDDELTDLLRYIQAVGSLIYAMVATRPDLAYVVGKLS